MSADGESFVVLGVITGAHGIRGEVRLKSFTGEPQAVADYGPLTTPDGRTFEILSLKPAKSGFIARIKGVTDRNAAEALKGVELRLPRARLPEPEQDEFYHDDLVGLPAHTVNGDLLGHVIAVHDFGAGPLLDIRLTGSRNSELIPFTTACVPEVDIPGRHITVVAPENDETREPN